MLKGRNCARQRRKTSRRLHDFAYKTAIEGIRLMSWDQKAAGLATLIAYMAKRYATVMAADSK
jgi:hypothetical protein